MSLASSSEFVAVTVRPLLASSERLPWGLLALLRGITARSPLTGRVPGPAYVPSSAFLALSTVCSSALLTGLFHPATTSEIRSSGVFPDNQPPWLVASACPPVVAIVRLLPGFPGSSSSRQLAFRALIRLSIRRDQPGCYAGWYSIPS